MLMQVLERLLALMCDVREACDGARGDDGDSLSVRLEWRERWAVVCVPGGVMDADEMGRTALHAAAHAGNVSALTVLLEARCVQASVCLYVYMFICIHVYMYECVYVCMCECVNV